MLDIFTRRLSLFTYFVVLILSLFLAATLGVVAVNETQFAHVGTEVHGFTGSIITTLSDAELNTWGNPARINCGRDSCLNSISQTGEAICYQTATRIFGAGTCRTVTRTSHSKKNSWTEQGYICTATVPASLAGCEGSTHWEEASGGRRAALRLAISSMTGTCCPQGTIATRRGENFYCLEEGR